MPLPGEATLSAAAGDAGATHHLNIVVVFLVAASAAILGDNAGYWLGRAGGLRLAERYGHFVRLDAPKLKIGRDLFQPPGGKAVFFRGVAAALPPPPPSPPPPNPLTLP